MNQEKVIQGFSKISREEKIRIAAEYASQPVEFARELFTHWHPEQKLQKRYAEFSENAVSNFYLPYSLAPNFRINGKDYIIPMVTEESSVVAAASAAAKFWWQHGGFKTQTGKLLKPGHIHFIWKGNATALSLFINQIKPGLMEATSEVEKAMRNRGGGIVSIQLKNPDSCIQGYYQLEVVFNTMNAMGANFINTCLETMTDYMIKSAQNMGVSDQLEIIMAIMSNYTPQCLVECTVECPVSAFDSTQSNHDGKDFGRRFSLAVSMAQHDISRAVTHNKGIFNGVDAVLIATGNDFRAVEAAGHAWASRNGAYRSLSEIELQDDRFLFRVTMPMPLGVVGGITNLHPMAKASLQLLGNPEAADLMSIASVAGLANHFSAIKALITHGIQHGHMKMHLLNILNQLAASMEEKELALQYFINRTVSFADVREFLSVQRS